MKTISLPKPGVGANVRISFYRSLWGKLIGAFLIATGLTLIVGLAGYFQIAAVRDILTGQTVTHVNARYYTTRLGLHIAVVNDSATEYSLGRYDPALREDFAQADREMRAGLEEVKKWMTSSPEEQIRWMALAAAYEEFFAAGQAMMAERDALEAANQSFAASADQIKASRAEIKKLVLGQGYVALEDTYWRMAYREKEFLWQYRDDEHQQEVEADLAAFRDSVSASGLPTTTQQQVSVLLDAYAAALDQAGATMYQQKAGQAAVPAKMETFDSLRGVLLQEAGRLMDLEDTRLNEARAAANARVQAVLMTSLILVGMALVIGLGLGVLSARAITRPVKRLATAAEAIARGDVNQQMDIASRDEIGVMAGAFRDMVAYLKEMTGVAGRLAQGDLNITVTPRSEQDALGVAFSQMIANLRALVGQVAESANNVEAASGHLTTAANQAEQATSQIAMTIQQVANGAAQQTEGVTRTAMSVEQMKRAIDGVARGAQEQAAAVNKASSTAAQITSAIRQVAGNVQAVTKDSTMAAEAARAGSKAVQETIMGMTNIIAKVGVSSDKVTAMGQRSDQIGAIVETIDDIASQTNLLALNAAIEAARAGEHGKGFAVVADEVRKLAERASAATKEIGSLIRGIQQTVSEAVAAMDEGSKEVEIGAVRVSESGEALSNILKAVEAVNQQAEAAYAATQRMNTASNELVSAMDEVSAVVEENTAATEEMAAGSGEVTQSIENIASVSEENSAAVEEVSANAEETSAQVQKTAELAQVLARMAQDMRATIARFRGEAGDSAETRGEIQMVGSSFSSRIAFVRSRYGESGWARVLTRLSPSARSRLSQPINPAQMYSQSLYVELIGAIKAEFGRGREGELAREMAQYVAEIDLTGAYRSIVPLTSPEAALAKIPALWRLQVGRDQTRVAHTSPGLVMIDVFHGGDADAELCQHSLVGYLEAVVRLAGARRFSVKHSLCLHRGDDRCRYDIRWEEATETASLAPVAVAATPPAQAPGGNGRSAFQK